MIKRKSYTEALEAGALDYEFDVTQSEPNLNCVTSSSDSGSDLEEETMFRKSEDLGLIRSNSLQYYDMRNSIPSADAVSEQTTKEILDTCIEYVENEKVSIRPISNLRSFEEVQQILDDSEGTKVDDEVVVEVMDEDQTLLVNQNIAIQNNIANYDEIETDEDFYEEQGNSFENGGDVSFPRTYVGRNSTRKSRKTPEFSGSRAKKPKRVIFKNGETNIPLRNNIAGRAKFFFDDYVTSLIELRWRWVFLIFCASNFIVWTGFALMFYVAAYANGDLDESPEGTPCIAEGRTFTGIFTFSVETQVSIGYGEKYPNEECPEVIFIMLMEVVVGYIMIGALVCIVYAKIARPEKHVEGVGFSKYAVVCMRDGKLCLVFRVWDCLEKHSIGCQLKGKFIKHTAGGTILSPLIMDSSPLLFWPITVQHTMDEKSPLYNLSAKDLIDKRFEIIITLTGANRNTGQMSQTRTSYMPHEILWGSKFKTAITYNHEYRAYVIDKKAVNSVESVDIPLCSSKWLKHVNNTLNNRPTTSLSVPSSPLYMSPAISPFSSPTSLKIRKLQNSSELERKL